MELNYNEAISEYESEDEISKNKIIYAYFGLAVYQSQCIEELFAAMLYSCRIINNKVKTNKEVVDIINAIENSKSTMGTLINEVKQAYDFPENIKNELQYVLTSRNYIVHKYFKIHIIEMYSDQGRRKVLRDFCNFIDKADKLTSTLKPFYNNYMIKMGITKDRIKQYMDKIKEQNSCEFDNNNNH